MSKTFVAVSDPVHDLLRSLTRKVPLHACISPQGRITMLYAVQKHKLPHRYVNLAWNHSIKGIPAPKAMAQRPRSEVVDMPGFLDQVCYFDVVKLDRRCIRDLRLKLHRTGPYMVACELLTFGTGTLRARNDNPNDRLHTLLLGHYGRLAPKDEQVFATIRSLSSARPPVALESWKESYDSTNVIYGDALGEIQQLWDRRADMAFLEQVAQSLHAVRTEARPAAFLSPSQNAMAAVRLHLEAQSLWRRPPANGRALLRRVERILDNTVVDHFPRTVFLAPSEPPNSAQPHLSPEDDRDDGYDGWLSGTGSV